MPLRAFFDSDDYCHRHLVGDAVTVLMPLRAFFDSDTAIAPLTDETGFVLMPLRAFFDSDASTEILGISGTICLNALTGIF